METIKSGEEGEKKYFFGNANKIADPNSILITKQGIESASHLSDESEKEADLSGVLCNDVQYYDLKNVPYINNNGLASLVDLLRALTKKGISLRFVNANKKIKAKIKAMGLEKHINCS
jgi:ABC-type transporter Mla MlaB component